MGQMKRIILGLAVGAMATTGLLPAGAGASGPAAPGKRLLALQCEGLGPVTLSVSPAEGSNGAAQVVGQKGHGIVVKFTSVIVDATTEATLKDESREPGGGQAHPNQATEICFTFFLGRASQFFENEPLPPGVEPNDIIVAGTEAFVIPKP
jgi:hypothetical protein